MNKPHVLTGAAVGGLFTIPLIMLFFIGQGAAGLPFPPFELFDWLVRVLPAPIINIGKETLADVITALQMPTSDTAKLAEQGMGLAFTVMIGALASAIFFAVMNKTQHARNEILPGVGLGLGVGIPFVLMGLGVTSSITSAEPIRALIWSLGVFVLYGIAVSYVWNRLAFNAPLKSAQPQPTDASVQVVEENAGIDRRSFIIKIGAATAVIAVTGAGLSEILRRSAEPNSSLPSLGGGLGDSIPEATLSPEALAQYPALSDTLVPAVGTRPELTPLERHYRIDINANPPVIEEAGYLLTMTTYLNGGRSVLGEFTLDEIRAMPAREDFITMACISNRLGGDLISTVKWTGVSMQEFLSHVDIPANATHLFIMSIDGFDETLSLEMIANDPRIMLSYAWDDQPLLQKHGFPLRVHIPDLYGMKQPKWITQIEFISGDREGYWVRRGWDAEAVVRSTSVIDTVAVNATYSEGDQVYVPVGGIAWAGDRGILGVEVRVDGGAWQPAQVRVPVSDRTWSLWRYDWAFQAGDHTFEVRCIEGDGTRQIEQREGTYPSGSTGILSRSASL